MDPKKVDEKVEVVNNAEKKLVFERWTKTSLICLSFLVSLVGDKIARALETC